MAFSTVTGSNGVTSLVGTTGIDTATIVSLTDDVVIRANTGDDVVTTNVPFGQISGYNVRMGGGDDDFFTATVLTSFISMDGETLANDGDDEFIANRVFGSEIVGRGGDDDIIVDSLFSSTVNGNTGKDLIVVDFDSSDSFVYGGQGDDEIFTDGAQRAMLYNGNKGADRIILGADTFVASSVYGGQGGDTIDADLVVVADVETAGVFLSGDLGDDAITGSDGEDTINGGEGDDLLVAGSGADTIDGGAGDDEIIGGTEGDVITTGAGNDEVFLVLTDSLLSADSNTGFDTITDFSANTADLGAGEDVNGDLIVTLGGVTTYTAAGILTSGGVDLETDLANAATGIVAGEVVGVSIRQAAWSGNYLVIGGATGGFDIAEDAVIEIGTSIAGLTVDAFV